ICNSESDGAEHRLGKSNGQDLRRRLRVIESTRDEASTALVRPVLLVVLEGRAMGRCGDHGIEVVRAYRRPRERARCAELPRPPPRARVARGFANGCRECQLGGRDVRLELRTSNEDLDPALWGSIDGLEYTVDSASLLRATDGPFEEQRAEIERVEAG